MNQTSMCVLTTEEYQPCEFEDPPSEYARHIHLDLSSVYYWNILHLIWNILHLILGILCVCSVSLGLTAPTKRTKYHKINI